MLGEQLIKNDRIALVELIKNSYDADASIVTVDFVGFSEAMQSRPGSRIVITDNGTGMSEATVRDHWLNPATPTKHDFKRHTGRSLGGRVMQGEKGIGRFAMFKLGNHVELVTRAGDSADEFVVDIDLSFLDERTDTSPSQDLRTSSENDGDEDARTAHVFIDEIEVDLTRRPPSVFTDDDTSALGFLSGTRLEVSGLRSRWTRGAVEAAYSDVSRLQPLIPQAVADPMAEEDSRVTEETADFKVVFMQDGIDLRLREAEDVGLRELFEERSVLRVSGHFSEVEKSFLLNVNEHVSVLPLDDPDIEGLWVFRRYFLDRASPRSVDEISCGPFDFSLYVFDLTARAPAEYRLDSDERDKVREHRIYLYRDGVRVLPYGDVEDDWLQLDMIRGQQAAGRVLSNDQTVGFVYITQERNPLLQDKTNREGLLESGHALSDFVTLLQLVISYLRRTEFARYLAQEEQKREAVVRREREVMAGFKHLLDDERLPRDLKREVTQLERKYLAEKDYMDTRVERTEDLAGVGLSVEAASHDIVSAANHALRLARALATHIKAFMPEETQLVSDSAALVEGLSFVSSRLEDVQGLFVSTRKGRRLLDPADFVTKVYRIYSSVIQEREIRLDLVRDKTALKVRTTDAALLQVLVNLFDNSIYWLTVGRTQDPVIQVQIDASKKQLTFADNGPGVRPADEPFIFEPFFSGKGQAGKGLGLYIARQVSLRNGFEIALVTDERHKVASGANFVLRFAGVSDDRDD
jgi:signal transduction histidine kinase